MYKSKILANLRSHNGKWVNYFCAVRDIESCGNDDLNELIHEGKIESKVVNLGRDKFDQPIKGNLYRLVFEFTDYLSAVK